LGKKPNTAVLLETTEKVKDLHWQPGEIWDKPEQSLPMGQHTKSIVGNGKQPNTCKSVEQHISKREAVS